MKKILLSAILAFATHSAYAVDCNNAMTQADINQCAGAEYKKSDVQLNKVYKQVIGKVDPSQQLQLKTAQNAWIKFRDADCAFQTAAVEGGSLYATVLTGCLEAKTATRTKELATFLHCKEGDSTCVFSAN